MSDEPEITIDQLEDDGGALEDYIRHQLETEPHEFRVRFRDPEGVSLTMMPVPRCESCKWWDRQGGGEMGSCNSIGSRGSAADFLEGDTLVTTAEFGCVQWEGKA